MTQFPVHRHSPGLPLHAPLHISSPAHGDTPTFPHSQCTNQALPTQAKQDTFQSCSNSTRHKPCEAARTRHSLALIFATARPPHTGTDTTGRPRPTNFRSSNSPPAHGGHITCNLSDSVYSTHYTGRRIKTSPWFCSMSKRNVRHVGQRRTRHTHALSAQQYALRIRGPPTPGRTRPAIPLFRPHTGKT